MNAQDLKNSILQLAIQGKLVEQRKEEGTAKELIEEIKAEKERLIKEKKIKKEKPLAEIAESDIPFEIPESWEWVRLGDCVSNKSGVSYKKDNLNLISQSMTRILRGGNILDLTYKFKSDDIMLDRSFVKSELLLNKNMLITPAVTSLEHIGKMARIEQDYTDVAVGGFVLMLIPHINIDVFSEFLLFALSSQYHRNLCRSITNKSGQAFYNLSREKLMAILVPIPPLEEQKRIVAKIEEIMPYIEKYGTAHSKLEIFNKKFPEDMQKSILQYAIQGKLVEQREEEGTAEELYKYIQEEKEKLIKEKKIKREKPLPEITEDEVPFEIPESWKWVRLDNISYKIGDIDHKMPPVVEGGYPYISPVNFTSNGIDYDNAKTIGKEDFDNLSKKIKPTRNDIIFPRYGTIGVVRMVETDREFLVSYSCCTIKNFQEYVLSQYIFYVLQSGLIKSEINRYINKTTQPNIGLASIKRFLIPLPPLAEQKRIVDKIEEMLPYCTQLVK